MPQPLFAGGPGAAQDIFLQELPSSLGATLRATASSAFDTNPANLLYQEYESFSANRDENSPVLSADDARKRISDAKLKLTVPDAGIRESALNLLMESKYQEKVWQDTISRGPTGFAAGTARFVTGLGVSILDPINIAIAFIPVVGEAKVASMLARAGSGFGARALVRAEVGAVEGFVGAAAVEPFVYGMAHDLQKDYTMADSLMNLAFGTVLGGGLHVGVGAIRDHVSGGGDIRTTPPAEGNGKVISEMTPEQRMDTFRSALAQAVDGRAVNIEPLVRLNENLRAADRSPEFLRTADETAAPANTGLRQEGATDSNLVQARENVAKLEDMGRAAASPDARVLPDDVKAAEAVTTDLRTTEVKPHEADPAKVAETEKAALTEESQELKALEDAVEQKEPTKFTAEDAQIEQSETLAKAAEALARCQLRG